MASESISHLEIQILDRNCGPFFYLLWQLAYTNHLGSNLKKAEIHCQQKIQKLKDDQHKELAKAQDKANQASADYEKLKSEQRVKNEVVIKEVQKIIDRPVYRNVCIDDDGVRQLNSLIDKITLNKAFGCVLTV